MKLPREQTLHLPRRLRRSLKEPMGELFSRSDLGAAKDACGYIQRKELAPVIAVGDLVSMNLSRINCQAMLSILDGKTRRHDKLDHTITAEIEFRTKNPPAQIRPELWIAIDMALMLGTYGKTTKLLIEGEEDLAALPAVALAPNGSAVVYGQPGEGMVVITVSATQKQKVADLLQQMVQQNENKGKREIR